MSSLPKKIEPDPIAEAIFEVRFEAETDQQMPELITVGLANNPQWKSFNKVRLPLADVPMFIRQQTPNFIHQPVMELQDAERKRVVKLGHNVLSYHALAPYPGWKAFRPELEQMVGYLFTSVGGVQITRLGLRYLNLFRPAQHGVERATDLYLKAEVAGSPVGPIMSLTYMRDLSEEHRSQVRLASPDYVVGPNLGELGVLVDVDVFTPNLMDVRSEERARSWLEAAHDLEKTEFFTLFTEKMKKELVVE